MSVPQWTAGERRFAARAVRRKNLFLGLSICGLMVAVGLVAVYAWMRMHDASFPLGARAVIVLLVLLNARQNLRQYRYAGVLAKTLEGEGRSA